MAEYRHGRFPVSDCLSADYGDPRDAATAVALTAKVPSCPGWTVADLVYHVAEVYLHKVTVMRTGEVPQEWPPPGLTAEAPLAVLGRAYGALRAEFRTRGPGLPALTWYWSRAGQATCCAGRGAGPATTPSG